MQGKLVAVHAVKACGGVDNFGKMEVISELPSPSAPPPPQENNSQVFRLIGG
jgi:hypothetical protein